MLSQKTLTSLIEKSETNRAELQNAVSQAEQECLDRQMIFETPLSKYDELISWAQMYDTASNEAKKMIVNELLVYVEVFRDKKTMHYFDWILNSLFSDLRTQHKK